MRTTFVFATLLFALTAVCAPVADAEAEPGLEKREHHRHVEYETVTVKHHHTVTKHDDPTPTPFHTQKRKHKHDSDSSEDSPKSSHKKPSHSSSSGHSSVSGSDDASVLDSHNAYRAKHGVNPLEWDDNLAQFAADYASGCVFEHTGGNTYRLLALTDFLGPYGENLAAGYGSATEAVDAWYNEVKDYDFNNQGFSVRSPFH